MSASPLNLVVIGAGSMGSALVSAWSQLSDLDGRSVNVSAVEPAEAVRARLRADGIDAFAEVGALPAHKCAVFAVKPQILGDVLAEYATLIETWRAQGIPSPLVISIAAGVTTETIEEALPDGIAVVRTMPNLALTVGRAVTALCAGAAADEADLARAKRLFDAVGRTVRVEEALMDAVCALSGSGPAYFALLAESMASAGQDLGLSPEVAETLANETLIGTAALLERRGWSAAELRRLVTSPQGTTEAAINAMRGAGLPEAVARGVEAAWARGRELGRKDRS